MITDHIIKTLGIEGKKLLNYKCSAIPKKNIVIPKPNIILKNFLNSNRNNRVLVNLMRIINSGRLSNTGYVSILPIDQGIEHSGGASFSKNINYFNPEKIVELAIESGCSAVASSLGVLGLVSRKYACKIPFILKINHNETLSYPNKNEQIMFASVKQAFDMGAAAVGATVYFGSKTCSKEIREVSSAFQLAHELGMVTVLWCYLRNKVFSSKKIDYHLSSDLTGQANHLGVSIEADFIKQKQPINNMGYKAVRMKQKNNSYGNFDNLMYKKLTTNNAIDLCRYQVINCFSGKIGLINSGGPSNGNFKEDYKECIRSSIINKRAGGYGMIVGRKAFQCSKKKGIKILNKIQDIYLSKEITIA
jgi:class I fructose-bisphosphate aldolase